MDNLAIAEKEHGVKKSWFDDFFSIPAQFRCNPFNYSPSGDIFYADQRNVEHIKSAIVNGKSVKSIKISTKEELNFLLNNL